MALQVRHIGVIANTLSYVSLRKTSAVFHALPRPSPHVHNQRESEDVEIAPTIRSLSSHQTRICSSHLSELQRRMEMGEYPHFPYIGLVLVSHCILITSRTTA